MNATDTFSSSARLESVRAPSRGSFEVVVYDQPFFHRGWHFHPEAELTLIVESSGRRFVGDHVGDFQPGDLVLLGPNLPHAWRNSPASSPVRARSMYVHFPLDLVSDARLGLPELRELRLLMSRAARGLRFADGAGDAVARDLDRIHRCSGLRRLILFWDLLQRLAESPACEPLATPGFAPRLDEPACERIRRIRAYVYRNFKSEIVHRELSREAGMTGPALSRFFHRTSGCTITEFINEVRVGEATKLLIDTAKNVSEIAYASGFGSIPHFNSVFRRVTGLNPRRLRALHQGARN